jgi:hypothetical protein
MSAPRQHPSSDLLAIAEETARIMWRSYDDHLRHASDSPAWEKRAWEIYQRCMACSEHVWKIKQMHENIFGANRGVACEAG